MTHSMRTLFLTAVVFCIAAVLLLSGNWATLDEAEAKVLQASPELKWYKGNIHTHSLWSDGDDYLEMIGLWYKEHDYDFLCFTDHNVLANKERWIDVEKSKGKRKAFDKLKERFPKGWVEERMNKDRLEVRLTTFEEVKAELAEKDKFLLIQGEEITDRFKNFPVHMNVTNVKELIPPMGGESVYETMQRNTNAAIAQRERTGQPMIIHLNHPNFGYGVTAEDLMRVRGDNFFEVYNGHPGVRNSGNNEHASTERIWDIILTKRIAELGLPMMFGLGTDDGHNYHNIPSRRSEPGRGWVMVLAEALTPAALIEAMEAGRFYASSGVTLSKTVSSPKGLTVEVKKEADVDYAIKFIGTRKGFDSKGKPVLGKDGKPIGATLRYSDDIGTVLETVEGTKAKYTFSGDELYVRALITSTKKHPNPSEPGEFERAWTQPVKGPSAP